MNLKKVVRGTEAQIAEVSKDEDIVRIELEEIDVNATSGEWRVVSGFHRARCAHHSFTTALTSERCLNCSFTIVHINSRSSEIRSFDDRLLTALS